MFKKIITTIILAVMVSSLLISFPASADYSDFAEGLRGTKLYVYNWGEYISEGKEEGSLDVNKRFEELYGIEVIYDTFSTNEDLYTKIKSGGSVYDVIIPSDYMIQRMINEDLIQKLNFDNIPNYENIGEQYRDLYFDSKNEYSVPYNTGMVGIIYNTEKVSETVDSWSILWDEKYSGQILQIGNYRDAFSTAQFLLGIDVNTNVLADWDKAAEKLLEQKPLVQSYVMDDIYNIMESDSAALSVYYAGDFFTMYENNENLAFVYPKEGTNIFVDSMCVPKNAKNKDAAELYINFMLSEEIAIANAEYICYASPNKAVYENEDYIDYLSDLHEDAYEILYAAAQDDSYNKSYFHNLEAETLAHANDLWDKVKTTGFNGLALYIIAGSVVAIFAGLLIYRAYNKKKREV